MYKWRRSRGWNSDHAYNLTISTFLPVELGIVDKIMLILFKVDNARIDIDVLMVFFLSIGYTCV